MDQCRFPFPEPFFQSLLTRDGVGWPSEFFDMNEMANPILLAEGAAFAYVVFTPTTYPVVGNAGVPAFRSA